MASSEIISIAILTGLLMGWAITSTITGIVMIRNRNHRLRLMQLELHNYLLWLIRYKHLAHLGKSNDQLMIQSLSKEFDLTKRECQVLELLLSGFGNHEIAEKLFISENTVKSILKIYISSLM